MAPVHFVDRLFGSAAAATQPWRRHDRLAGPGPPRDCPIRCGGFAPATPKPSYERKDAGDVGPLPLVGPERYRQSAKATKMPTRQRVTFLSDPTEMRLGYIVK